MGNKIIASKPANHTEGKNSLKLDYKPKNKTEPVDIKRMGTNFRSKKKGSIKYALSMHHLRNMLDEKLISSFGDIHELNIHVEKSDCFWIGIGIKVFIFEVVRSQRNAKKDRPAIANGSAMEKEMYPVIVKTDTGYDNFKSQILSIIKKAGIVGLQ